MSQPTWIGYKLNDRYLIEQELGSGGMSAVYKATDPNLKRVVAIKLIHPHLSNNPDFVRRFEAEASAVAQLRHPNIVQVHDFNHDGDTYYMVLEFVPGETLQQRLRRLNNSGRRMTADEVIKVAARICDAVDYAHRRGLVHRDIKPANVMLNVQDEPILMDFGIVRILGGTSHTATGAVVGTALYMAPEQVKGEHPDHRADIYSLGVMLYEMVSGKPPYNADSAMTIMMMHLHDPIPDLSDAVTGYPPGIKDIIERALAKTPDQRFQSASEMAAALRALRTAPAGTTAAGTVVEQPTAAAATYVEPPAAAKSSGTGTGPTFMEPAAQQPPASSAPPPARPVSAGRSTSAPPPTNKKTGNRLLLFGGGGLVLLLLACIIIAAIFVPRLLGDGQEQADATRTAEIAAIVETDTPTPEPTATATDVPPTNTPTPTSTPTITPTPTATQPEGPYVLITDIQIEGGAYAVYYETFNFEPYISSAAGTNHIHFFWNTYAPETVGTAGIGDSVGGGSWYLYDVPSPFEGYAVSNRPQGATQICALVANNDHSINLNTGNCFDLPE